METRGKPSFVFCLGKSPPRETRFGLVFRPSQRRREGNCVDTNGFTPIDSYFYN